MSDKIELDWDDDNILVIQKEFMSKDEQKNIMKLLDSKPKFIICDTSWSFFIIKRKYKK